MQNTDVVIIGGGLAGSMAAAMLGRAGIDAILVDPHTVYPPDFRCEKLDSTQVAILERTGLAADILRSTTPDRATWVARFGRVIEKRPGDQQGIYYAPLVNAARALIPGNVRTLAAKATALAASGERQLVALSTGEEISARLIVLANGLSVALRHNLGLTRTTVSPCHSITIGFDAVPAGRPAFDFPALTYYAERTSDRAALITLFPIGAKMRANLFVYCDMADPWLKKMRSHPQETLFALWPGLRKIMGDFTADGPVQIRPIDLYVTDGHRQGGVVLVGDAFATSCPAAGTGARKVLNDVERLCNVHIPQWLKTPGMSADKISAFYDDPQKQAVDDFARDKAYSLKAFSTSNAPQWRARRLAKFLMQGGVGTLRRLFGEQNAPVAATSVVSEHDVTLVPAPARQRVNDASTQTAA
ncbi:MAG TPA: NAD(P)/FAD-dependent oxidoreductase [Pseudolabrys sp.]|nr:NAD(P)/FAD-dependent oxidoreductase [Pseudolabrys sp.]